MLVGDGDGLRSHPMRARDGLARKGLKVLNGMLRSIIQKLADDLNAFIVGNMDGGFIVKGLAMQVLAGTYH